MMAGEPHEPSRGTAKGVRNEVFNLTVLEAPHKLAVGKYMVTFIWGYASSLDELWRTCNRGARDGGTLTVLAACLGD